MHCGGGASSAIVGWGARGWLQVVRLTYHRLVEHNAELDEFLHCTYVTLGLEWRGWGKGRGGEEGEGRGEAVRLVAHFLLQVRLWLGWGALVLLLLLLLVLLGCHTHWSTVLLETPLVHPTVATRVLGTRLTTRVLVDDVRMTSLFNLTHINHLYGLHLTQITLISRSLDNHFLTTLYLNANNVKMQLMLW